MVYEKKEIDFKKLDNSNCQILEKIQKDKYTINWNEDEIKNLLEKGGGEGIILIYNSIPCLLYTSPSPRDATLSRMPSSA